MGQNYLSITKLQRLWEWINNLIPHFMMDVIMPFVYTCQNLCGPSINHYHYGDVIMGTIASQITSLTIVYSTVYSGADQRKHQSSASLAFVRGIHRGSVNSPHKWPVTRKMFPFDDVIMMVTCQYIPYWEHISRNLANHIQWWTC